ncbi:hypothetical protein BCE02nite_58820 [Brevibacillus centrosporus]|nr:hypothetical protein BCE02nite_58820 [Brevibacillus centrosporus]
MAMDRMSSKAFTRQRLAKIMEWTKMGVSGANDRLIHVTVSSIVTVAFKKQ